MYHLQQLLRCEMALRNTRKGWILCQEFEPLVYLLGSLLFCSQLCSFGVPCVHGDRNSWNWRVILLRLGAVSDLLL